MRRFFLLIALCAAGMVAISPLLGQDDPRLEIEHVPLLVVGVDDFGAVPVEERKGAAGGDHPDGGVIAIEHKHASR